MVSIKDVYLYAKLKSSVHENKIDGYGMSEDEKIVSQVVDTLVEHKGLDIVKIDLRRIENCFCRFFVVCHGTSNTHVGSMADFVEDDLRERLRERPMHVEGAMEARWIVMDYGSVVVHLFQKETRDFYQLEDFWADADVYRITG